MKSKEDSMARACQRTCAHRERWSKAPRPSWWILIAGAIFALAIWHLLRIQEIRSISITLDNNSKTIETKIKTTLESYFQTLEYIAKSWEVANSTSKELREAEVREYIKHYLVYQAIGWVDPTYHVRWIVSLKENESALKLDLGLEKKEALNTARDEQKPIVASAGNLVQSGEGILYLIPLIVDNKFDGFLLAVFRSEELLDGLIPNYLTEGFSLVVHNGSTKVFQRDVENVSSDPLFSREIGLTITKDIRWKLRIKPSRNYIDDQRTRLPDIIFIVSIVLTFFFERTISFRKQALFSSASLEMTNQELRKYVEELEVIKTKLEKREAELQQQHRAALNIASDAKLSQNEANFAKRIAQEHSAVFQAVVDSTPIGLLGVNNSGEISFVNDILVEMFGYNRDELMGRPVEVLVPTNLHREHREYLQNYLASPDARPMGEGRDLQGRRKDGMTFPVEIGLRPVIGGSDLRALAAVTNITERKRITDELRFRNEEMEQLLYTVSHDLKSPLITIQGFSGMISEALGRNDVEDAQDSAARVAKATKSMESLINDLLELNRIGRHEGEVERVDVEVLLEQVKDSMETQLSECGVVLLVKTPLPIINTDPKRLYQIFQNLIENALKYGCESPGDTISVGYEESSSHYKFWVRDTGPGISKEHQRKIFLLFQRLKSKKDGSGLGLAIVMKAARLLGGGAWVESEPGQGATFWFSIAKRSAVERPRGELQRLHSFEDRAHV